MLLTITTTHHPATDLTDMLRVDPYDVRTRRFSQTEAMAFVPQYDEHRCTVAVLVQPKGLGTGARPSSLATALDHVFEGVAPSALRSVGVDAPTSSVPLQVVIPRLSCRDSELRVRRLFEPLGYEVSIGADESVWLDGVVDVATLLTHLRECLPQLDDQSVRHCTHRASA